MVGTAWHVRIQPSATSSSSSASLTCIVHRPSTSRAMQVAQLPASHDDGGRSPICRAVCRIVVPGWCVAVSADAPVELDRDLGHATGR